MAELFIDNVISYFSTDSGVHALHNIFGLTLEPIEDIKIKPEYIVGSLNKKFEFKRIDMRALSAEPIADDFIIRKNVAQRTYLYRLAIIKQKYKKLDMKDRVLSRPLEDLNRCLYIE